MKEVKQNKYLHIDKINPSYKYSFRAEYVNDIIEFQNNLMSNELHKYNGWNLNYSRHNIFPDVDCELEIDLEIDKVREIMRLQTDSHVMTQSIKDYENYTGDRDFSIPY
jgi:hypothetical protein